MKIRQALAAITLICASTGLAAQELTVEVNKIRNTEGTISVILFDTKDSFSSGDYKKSEAMVTQKAQQGSMTFQFHNLTPGEYAFLVHHDENVNHKMDMQPDTPTEGYAYSNERGKFGIPSFAKAKIELSKDNNRFATKMIYLK